MGLGLKHEKDPFDDFLDSLKQPRQVMDANTMDVPPVDELPMEKPDLDDFGDLGDELESPQEQKQRYNLSMIPAETLVNCVDMAFTQVNSMIAKQKMEGASRDEKESLIQAAANYMKEKDIDISPGSMLVVMVLVIYAPKVWQAVELRKANEENEKLKLQLEAQKKKIKALENKTDEDERE